jgi:hypothetical protein
MRTKSITNDTIWTTDFAGDQRRAALRSIPAMIRQKDRNLAPGLSACGVWGRDVSAMDSRSVKASLAGRGDLRVFWWNVCSAVLRVFNQGSMERAMYSFHRAHHAATFFALEAKREVIEKAISYQDSWAAGAAQRR